MSNLEDTLADTKKPPWNGTKHQSWATPQWLVDECALRFAGAAGFDLDVAADRENAKAPMYYTEADDGLRLDWMPCSDGSGKVWCNPPYADIEPWVRKAHAEVEAGNCRLVVMLLPARCDREWWVFCERNAWHMETIRGRVRFEPPPGVVVARSLARLVYQLARLAPNCDEDRHQ